MDLVTTKLQCVMNGLLRVFPFYPMTHVFTQLFLAILAAVEKVRRVSVQPLCVLVDSICSVAVTAFKKKHLCVSVPGGGGAAVGARHLSHVRT